MSSSAAFAVGLVASYLVGSLPFGYLTARFLAGIDIRRAGSGNIGATNIGRVLGAKWGVAVLVLDCLKGLAPTLLLPVVLLPSDNPDRLHLQVACALAAVLGHMFPVWLRFRGGKGVATGLGTVLVLGSWATAAAAGTFAVVFAAFRIVSLASILASLAFAVTRLWLLAPAPFSPQTWSLAGFCLLVPGLIIYRHRANVTRLLKGTEPRFRAAASQPEPLRTEKRS